MATMVLIIIQPITVTTFLQVVVTVLQTTAMIIWLET